MKALILCFALGIFVDATGQNYYALHLKTSDSLQQLLNNAQYDSTKIRLLNEIAVEHGRFNEMPQMLDYVQQGLDLAKKTIDIHGEAISTMNLGQYFNYIDKYSEALPYANKAIQLFTSLKDNEGIATVYYVQGLWQYMRADHLNEAIENFKKAEEIYKIVNNRSLLASIEEKIGMIHFDLHNYSEAMKHMKTSLNLLTELNDKSGMAGEFNNIGLLYQEIGNYSEALKCYIESAKLRGLKRLGFNAMELYRIQGYYDEVLKVYFDELKRKVDIDRNDTNRIQRIKIIIGGVYVDKGDFDEAIHFLQEGIQTYNDKGLYWLLAGYESLAEAYLQKAKRVSNPKLTYFMDSAIYTINRALELNKTTAVSTNRERRQFNFTFLLAKGYLNRGTNTNNRVDLKKSLEILQNLDSDVKKINTPLTFKDYYQNLSEVYFRLGQYKEAYQYITYYNIQKDSIYNNESSQKIQKLRTQFEIDKAVADEKTENEKLALQEKARHEKAFADEKLKEQQVSAEEKARHEKAEYDESLRHERVLADQKLQQQQLILRQKLLDSKTLADERARLQKIENDEKLQHERALYEEQIKHQKTIAEQKRKQEHVLAEKEKRNNQMLAGSSVLFISGLFTVLYTRQRMQKRRAIEKADALHRMAELELQSLRAQLNPHFMFNSLNAIQELIMKDDTANSHIYLSRFSKLLRMLLENASQPFIPLQKEIDFLNLYLSLEKLRIPDLEYSMNIDPDLDPSRLMTPNMMLQPYIENAIWHGLSHKKTDRKLLVNMKKTVSGILFEIIDNGVGRKKANEMRSIYRKEHQSKGMELLAKRFELLSKQYGTQIQTTIIDLVNDNESAGTKIDISVPVSLTEIKSTNDPIGVN
jgi:tetratricopeptide (TPR) repeat protein